MTDYRLTSTMNMWTDCNTSMMEAFMTSDMTSLWPPPPPPSSSASTSIHLPLPSPIAPFNPDTLQQRLQALIEGARENWTYAIFWKSTTNDFPGGPGPVLDWCDGYYKGEEDKDLRSDEQDLITRMTYSIKRKMKDLRELMMKGDYIVESTFAAFTVDETVKNFVNTLGQTVKMGDFDFIVQFEGPKGTLYDGGSWKVRLKFPENYPCSPPSLTFVDPIFHPNISPSGGICVDLLGCKWDAEYDLLKVFEQILPGLLVQPNAASPYNQEAADLMLADEKAYAERVKAYNHHAG